MNSKLSPFIQKDLIDHFLITYLIFYLTQN